ncbi:unnamed protein product [Rhizoctonia solani]|uniref:Retrotransposon gag domain-containing protein n=1 Tax=Rhizoctonia solani TaxID=456999 RepID=A0A8H2WK05_9AGAM|nr:unnamed protein product [Rhizoctonia solani]
MKKVEWVMTLHQLDKAITQLTLRVAENEEVTKDIRSTVENISQQVNNIAGKVDEPRTPDQGNPTRTVDKTPQATTSGKQQVKLEPPTNIEWCHIQSNNESEVKDATPVSKPTTSGNKTCTISIPVGTINQSLSCTPGGSLKPIKVKAPEPFKGGLGTEAKQWAARMSGWLQLSATQFETEEDVVTFLLVNMEGTASAWALPHLANIGTEKATIKTAAEFDTAFERAFYDPDKQRAAE